MVVGKGKFLSQRTWSVWARDMGGSGEEKFFQFLGQWLNHRLNSFLRSSLGTPHFTVVFKTMVVF